MASLNLMDLVQAKHFCTPLTASTPTSSQSLAHIYSSQKAHSFGEGTSDFDVHRVSLLNSVERWLLFALSHYRRSLDMFVPAAAPWIQVTLYYSSFFSANALLGMFGGWVGHSASGNRVVDVTSGTPGSQELRLSLRLKSPNGAKGSHREFWDFFYDSAQRSLRPWAKPALQSGLDPVLGDINWQIDRRNAVNYDMYKAWDAALGLNKIKPNSFRKTVSADLATQIEATEALLRVALDFAATLGLHSFGYEGCGLPGTRTQIQRRLVTQQPPNLVHHAGFASFL